MAWSTIRPTISSNSREVVLTFDDGPWPANTQAVLAALAAQCVKATFFPIGKHATWYPEILRQVVAEGHTVGSHTWSHADLSKKTLAEAKDEIEKGISAVAGSAGQTLAPFFRFPALRQSAELMGYLGERNVAAFSTDLDSFDFKLRKPQQVVASVMTKLTKRGKGIVLMHDFQHVTASALPELLVQLKAGGYKVVHLRSKNAVATLPQYDAAILQVRSGQTPDARPTASIVRTVGQLLELTSASPARSKRPNVVSTETGSQALTTAGYAHLDSNPLREIQIALGLGKLPVSNSGRPSNGNDVRRIDAGHDSCLRPQILVGAFGPVS